MTTTFTPNNFAPFYFSPLTDLDISDKPQQVKLFDGIKYCARACFQNRNSFVY